MNIKSTAGRVLRKPESATEDDIKLLCQAVLEGSGIDFDLQLLAYSKLADVEIISYWDLPLDSKR